MQNVQRQPPDDSEDALHPFVFLAEREFTQNLRRFHFFFAVEADGDIWTEYPHRKKTKLLPGQLPRTWPLEIPTSERTKPTAGTCCAETPAASHFVVKILLSWKAASGEREYFSVRSDDTAVPCSSD